MIVIIWNWHIVRKLLIKECKIILSRQLMKNPSLKKYLRNRLLVNKLHNNINAYSEPSTSSLCSIYHRIYFGFDQVWLCTATIDKLELHQILQIK